MDAAPPDPTTFKQTRAPLVAAVASISIALTLLVTGLRLYVRRVLIRHVGWDDWVCLWSSAWVLVTCLVFIASKYCRAMSP